MEMHTLTQKNGLPAAITTITAQPALPSRAARTFSLPTKKVMSICTHHHDVRLFEYTHVATMLYNNYLVPRKCDKHLVYFYLLAMPLIFTLVIII
jgi:hypothetical protein